MRPATVTVDTTARYADCADKVDLRLTFDPGRPLEVRATLSNCRESVTWTWSRDVLADALREPAGMGDVRMWPDGDEIKVRLQGMGDGGGFCVEVIALPRRDVTRFVARTARVVPRGREPQHDWDGGLADLLDGAW